MKANVAWENEEVPTNGKVLAVASDFYSIGVPECVAALAADGCVQLFDVRDPANIKQVGTIPIANHTAECVLDCQYFYGRAGTIIDARGVLDGKAPKVIGNWIDELKAQGVDEKSCHHIREIRPGRAADRLPAVRGDLRQRRGRRLARAPEGPLHRRGGEVRALRALAALRARDKFVLIGGEQNFTGRCERNNSEFSVYSAEQGAGRAARRSSRARSPRSRPPATASTPTASRSPARSAAPCTGSRSTRRSTNGGLVAISEYEDGVRFLQITQDRQDQGAGLLPLARQLVVVAEVGRQGRRPVLDRLPARDRHPALEGRALRARASRSAAEARHQRRHAAAGADAGAGRAARRAGRASCARRAGRR